MFAAVRRRLTFANVVMTLALVFAMSGGAYAAKKYLITSTKQISPKVLKALAGKPGPAGAQGPAGLAGPVGPVGPAGLAGAAGKDGLPGSEGKEGPAGKNGVNGKSVVAASEPAGANCEQGGSNFEVEGTKVKHYACNGQTGFTEALPSGKTETGAWTTPFDEGEKEEFGQVAISFNIPLPGPLGFGEVHYLPPNEPSTTECPGTASEPKAAPGNLCIYAANAPNALAGVESAQTYGAMLKYLLSPTPGSGSSAFGSWAVTAP